MLAIFRTETFVADVARQIDWYVTHADLDEPASIELALRFASAVEETLEFLSRFPESGRRRAARFSDLPGYRGLNVFEPFGRFRIYYRVIARELHAERLLEGHRLAASDDR